MVNICNWCGAKYTVRHYKAAESKYCCKYCKDRASSRLVDKNCGHCGRIFKVKNTKSPQAKFCSRDCFREGISKNPIIEKACLHCGKKFKTRRYAMLYCDRKCYSLDQRTQVFNQECKCVICGKKFRVPEKVYFGNANHAARIACRCCIRLVEQNHAMNRTP